MSDIELITKLATIREIDFTALDFETAQIEAIEYISVSQTSAGVNDQFLQGDAARMFIDTFSYILNLLAFRADTLSNENFVSTATDLQNLIYQMEGVGLRPNNPRHSTVTLLAVPNTISASDVPIPLRFPIVTTGLDGTPVNFEIMNSANDYFNPVIIPSGVSNFVVKAFSGSYRTLNTVATGIPAQEVILPDFPVIENSIKTSVTRIAATSLTAEIIESTRVTEVGSLVDNIDDIIYKITYDAEGRARLTFSTSLFGIIPPKGFTIHVDYRVGGGSNTNVTIDSINTITAFKNLGGEDIQFVLSNPDTEGSGGAAPDDTETLKLKIPGLVRSNDNVVTTEDYEAVIKEIGGVQDVFALDRFQDQLDFSGQFGVPSNNVFIWVIPTTGGEVGPDLRQVIAGELGKERLTAIDNFIFNPIYINWTLVAEIELIGTATATEEDELGNTLRQRIEAALFENFGRDTAVFKNKVSFSNIISVIESFPEVADVVMTSPTQSLTAKENEVLRLLPANLNLTFTQ
jgi:hypothetical protein